MGTGILLISFLKSLTILIPLTIGLVRYNKMDKSYQPFIIYLFIGFIAEIVSFTFIKVYHASNAAPSNLFVLTEWLLILWQFYCWGFFRKSKKGLFILAILVAFIWIMENIVFKELNKDFSPYFRVTYYFVIILISVNVINYTIIHDNRNIFRNARFLICLSYIIFFTYKLIYEWAYQYARISGNFAYSNIFTASFGYVNALENFIFAIAVLLIPQRDIFNQSLSTENVR